MQSKAFERSIITRPPLRPESKAEQISSVRRATVTRSESGHTRMYNFIIKPQELFLQQSLKYRPFFFIQSNDHNLFLFLFNKFKIN